jgi:hypothetical protein
LVQTREYITSGIWKDDHAAREAKARTSRNTLLDYLNRIWKAADNPDTPRKELVAIIHSLVSQLIDGFDLQRRSYKVWQAVISLLHRLAVRPPAKDTLSMFDYIRQLREGERMSWTKIALRMHRDHPEWCSEPSILGSVKDRKRAAERIRKIYERHRPKPATPGENQ